MEDVGGLSLRQTINIYNDLFGEFLEDELSASTDPIVLFPANGSSVKITITMKYSDGRPAPGYNVSSTSRPINLTGAEWRTVDGLAPRFGSSANTIRQRISQGLVRMSCRITPSSATTDAAGRAIFLVDSFHVCGNENQPAADEVTFASAAGTDRAVIKSAVEGLESLTDNAAGGLTTAGLVGRHLQTGAIQILQAIGEAWQRVGNKPSGMPNFITVTGASMRWGGLNPPHMTHRFGGTADVRPIGTREGPVRVGEPHYHREATGIIVDFMKRTGASLIRFADNLPGVTHVDASHNDHIHVSWLRQPDEPWFFPSQREFNKIAKQLGAIEKALRG